MRVNSKLDTLMAKNFARPVICTVLQNLSDVFVAIKFYDRVNDIIKHVLFLNTNTPPFFYFNIEAIEGIEGVLMIL